MGPPTWCLSRGHHERRFRALPIGSRPTLLVLPVPRVECRACGVVRQLDITFADPRRSYTKRFEGCVLELSRRMTVRDTAAHLGVGRDPVEDIQECDPSRRFAGPKRKHLRRIAVDEIAVAKGHRYMTPVMDLDSGAAVFVGDGKGADAPKPSWKRRRPSGAKIGAVAMDRSAAYRGAVSAHPKDALIVSDHFHAIKPFNDKPSDLWRSLYHRANADQEEDLRGARWLLLKDPENLDTDEDEKTRLEEALDPNMPLATASNLKEDLRRSWGQPGKRFATAFLDDWLRRAEASGVKALQQMARTLAAHRSGLLAYYDAMITSGPMGGRTTRSRR